MLKILVLIFKLPKIIAATGNVFFICTLMQHSFEVFFDRLHWNKSSDHLLIQNSQFLKIPDLPAMSSVVCVQMHFKYAF